MRRILQQHLEDLVYGRRSVRSDDTNHIICLILYHFLYWFVINFLCGREVGQHRFNIVRRTSGPACCYHNTYKK